MSATRLVDAYNPQMGGGRWSFSLGGVPDDAFVTSDLLSITMEAYTAQPWVIQLSAFQYQGGNSALDPTFPSRNQTDSRGYFARVTWAVDGAQETADVDYRPSGGSLQVVASMIRVALGSLVARNPASPRPVLAGSLAPGSRHCQLAPTYTTAVQSAAAGGGSAMFPIPPRACAYRWMCASNGVAVVAALSGCQIVERGGDIATPTAAQTPGINLDASEQTFSMQNKSQWYQPDPRSQFVRVTNTDAVTSVPIAIQFLLDMG